MRRLATDHRAQGNDGVVALRLRELAHHDGQLEGARNPDDLDLLLEDAVAFQRIEGAPHQWLHHELIEARRNQHEA